MGKQSKAKRKRRNGGVTGPLARTAAWEGRKTIGVLSPAKRTLGEWAAFIRGRPDWAPDFTVWFVETYGERPDPKVHHAGARDYDLMLRVAAGAWSHLYGILNDEAAVEGDFAGVQKGNHHEEDGGGPAVVDGERSDGPWDPPHSGRVHLRGEGYPRSTGQGGIGDAVQSYLEAAPGDSPAP